MMIIMMLPHNDAKLQNSYYDDQVESLYIIIIYSMTFLKSCTHTIIIKHCQDCHKWFKPSRLPDYRGL